MDDAHGNDVQSLIYGVDSDDLSAADNQPNDGQDKGEGEGDSRESCYIKAIERAINGIKETDEERRLFTEREWDFLTRIAALKYDARYILIRLVLRKKAGGWYRLSDVRKYTMEVGQDGLRHAFEKLGEDLVAMDVDEPPPPVAPPVKKEDGPEIIDLTVDSDDEDAPVAGPSKISSDLVEDDEDSMDYFGRSEQHLSLNAGLHILTVDELKDIAKTMKISSNKLNKDLLITALTNAAAGQSVLFASPTKGKGKKKDDGFKQTRLNFGASSRNQNQTERLKTLMLDKVGKAIRLNPYIYKLVLRVHIIWFRATAIPESLFSPALFAIFKKRIYAEYVSKRDPSIWPDRETYLGYEDMLHIENFVDETLKPEPKVAGRGKSSVPVAQVFVPPSTPGLDPIRKLSTPSRTPGLRDVVGDANNEDENSNHRKARIVLKLLKDTLLDKFDVLLAAINDAAERRPEFIRFEAGYVLARILAKATQAAGTLKEYEFEEKILLLLLSQRRWGRRRRGRLYDRLALIQHRYLCKDEDGKKNMTVIRAARDCIIEALGDPDTTLVFRPALIHRLLGIEKTLRIAPEDRAEFEDVTLEKPPEVTIVAERVWDHPDQIAAEEKENQPGDTPDIQAFFLPTRNGAAPRVVSSAEAKKRSWVGKSYWQGKDAAVHVEIRAIEHYAEEGFKGLHSETNILTTMFGLLFWDIIFAPVPGAFETPWQMGPLDLAEESFLFSREKLIKARLDEIRAGEARRIVEANDTRYRENKTCCVGVNWDMCGREDLLEIVECFGGDVLAAICRLFCEDYAGRNSGVPDLIIWHPETKEFRFVEVKGPGDTLGENQKLWCHALMAAGCKVELCHVMDKEDLARKQAKQREREAKKQEKAAAKKNKTPKPRKRRASAPAKSVDVEPESEEEEAEGEVAGGDDDPWAPKEEEVDAEMSTLPLRTSKRQRTEAQSPTKQGRVKLEEGDDLLLPLAKRRKTV
ncbi:Fanconi-associated nuclease [Mycena kentingensis (nom. inval.)]|nr:Fanconi-associated nuclease [Mycena kentingensis (nom. inval.)]